MIYGLQIIFHFLKPIKNFYFKNFSKTIWPSLSLFIIPLILILFFPYLITTRTWFDIEFSENNGEIGDTIGGILTPFIAILAALLTFFAFWVQFQANKSLKKDLAKERFENKYYELLNIQRVNISEINIKNKLHGRKAFVYMFYEFQLCFRVVEKEYIKYFCDHWEYKSLSKRELVNIAYKFYFFGVGPNSNKIVNVILQKYPRTFINDCRNSLEKIQRIIWKKMQIKSKLHKVKYYTYDMLTASNEKLRFETIYYPFDGHDSKLGHYYRHLFQTILFLENEYEVFDEIDKSPSYRVNSQKYEYVKTLRAQLSNHEQLLLFYNVMSDFGANWNKARIQLLIKYRLVRNIPLPLATLGLGPKEFFKEELNEWQRTYPDDVFFEWDEFS